MLEVRKDILGFDTKVETLGGKKNYVFFDNAASTPALKSVYEQMEEIMKNYSNVHRGTGYKAFYSTELFDKAREYVMEFLGADKNDTAIFVKNTTEAINKFARIFKAKYPDSKIVVSEMDHHSNLLPWKKFFDIRWWEVNDNGRLELERLEEILKEEDGGVKLVAVTGASNVTGFTNPVHEIAKLAHKYGAYLFIDGAQLVPHRKTSMTTGNPAEKIDFLAFSAHKIYSPFGSGALLGDKKLLSVKEPQCVGGGTIKFVAKDEIIWADLPDREEAGTPNIPGAISLALTLKKLNSYDFKKLEKREEELASYFINKFSKLKKFTLLGDKNRTEKDFSVFSFKFERDLSPFLVASILSFEEGIGVRAGCFCAHPYLARLMNFSKEDLENVKNKIINDEMDKFPGAIRASLSFYNTEEEIDRLINALEKIERGEFSEYYYREDVHAFVPKDFKFKIPELI